MAQKITYADMILTARDLVERVLKAFPDIHPDSRIELTVTGDTASTSYIRSCVGSKFRVVGVVNLPAIDASTILSRLDMDRWLAYVIHEIGHQLFTDMDAYQGTTQRHTDEMLHSLVNGLEDARIEAKLLETPVWGGSRKLLGALARHAVARGREVGWNPNDPAGAGFTFAILGRVHLGVLTSNPRAIWDMMDPSVKRWFEGGLEGLAGCTETRDVVALARRLLGTPPDTSKDDQQQDGDQQGGDQQGGDQQGGDQQGGDQQGGDQQDGDQQDGDQQDGDQQDGDQQDGDQQGGDQQDGDQQDGDQQDGDQQGGDQQDGDQQGGDQQDGDQQGGRSDGDDITGSDGGGYSPDGQGRPVGDFDWSDMGHATPIPVDVQPTTGDEALSGGGGWKIEKRWDEAAVANIIRSRGAAPNIVADWAAGVPANIGAARQKLWRLFASPERIGWSGAQEGGRFEVRKSTRVAVGSTNVFKRRWDKPGVDTSVGVLLDLSGSMAGNIRMVTDATFAILDAAQRAQCEHALWGFTSSNHGGGAVVGLNGVMPILPSRPGDHFSITDPTHQTHTANLLEFVGWRTRTPMLQEICAHMRLFVGGGTPDYAGVCAAIEEVGARKSKRRILFVVTDGEGDGDGALREAIHVATRLGVEVVGLGIGRDVAHLYPVSARVDNPRDIAGTAIDLIIKQMVQGGAVAR